MNRLIIAFAVVLAGCKAESVGIDCQQCHESAKTYIWQVGYQSLGYPKGDTIPLFSVPGGVGAAESAMHRDCDHQLPGNLAAFLDAARTFPASLGLDSLERLLLRMPSGC